MKNGHGNEYDPKSLPLPGTREFNVAAEAAATDCTTEMPDQSQKSELRIPRKHIILPPGALRATKELEEAVHYALQQTTDDERFIELEYAFKEFGYYYPYWIITDTIGYMPDIVEGGRFLYKTVRGLTGTPKEIIKNIFDQKEQWEAFGGDLNLLCDDPDIDAWLESTADHQSFVIPVDINPIYDLFKNKVKSEVQRIYRTRYDQPTPQIIPLTKTDNSTAGALIRLSNTYGKLGVTKGVHFDGSLSEEDAVELVNETDITKFMRLVSAAGKPRIECMVRCATLGSNISTHSFLPNDFLEVSAGDSGFLRASIAYHMELVFDLKYTKGTDKFKQAIIKALDLKSDKEKYQELQKVFGTFGYYYPSSISLGGRMFYSAYPNDPSGVWLPEDGIKTIDILINRAYISERVEIETTGGNSIVTGCQGWIDSIQTNQTRIQFGSLIPIYELLEDEQRIQVLRLYEKNWNLVDNFPEIPKGSHFDGMEARDPVIEFTEDKINSKMLMLRKFSGQPSVEHVELNVKGFEGVKDYLSLDIETEREFPGSVGFVSGSEGACKERSIIRAHNYSETENTYSVLYLQIYDEFIKPTSQFQEMINKALEAGKDDNDTYHALQGIFQRFGYYYPTRVQIGIISLAESVFGRLFCMLGGRIALHIPSLSQEDESQTQDKDLKNSYGQYSESDAESKTGILDITQLEEENQEYMDLENICMFEGGDSVVLLSNGVKAWIDTVESNQTVIQHREFKPVYELLGEEQRHKVQHIYENVIIEDMRVRYDYVLELKSYDNIHECERKGESETVLIPTEALFEKLLARVFPDSSAAIQFCRSTCIDYGFSVTEEKATDRIIYIYCSQGALSECTLRNLQNEEKQTNFCQWGVMLFEDDGAHWQFRKLANNDECMHSHTLIIQETGSHYASQRSKQATSSITGSSVKSKVIIKLAAEHPVGDQDVADVQYVRYGDIARLQRIKEHHDEGFISTSEVLNKVSVHPLRTEELLELKNDVENSEFDLLCDEDEDGSGSDIEKIDASAEKATVPSLFDKPHKTVHSLSTAIDCMSNDKGGVTDNYDYVRSDGIVIFESIAALQGRYRVYLRFINGKHDCIVSRRFTKLENMLCRCSIQPINQYAFQKERHIQSSDEFGKKFRLDSLMESIDQNPPHDQFILGKAYMYGILGLDIDNTQALKYLQLAADQRFPEAFYYLGKLFWRTEEYQKALNMYEESALYFEKRACCELGQLYHAGFSISHPTNSYAISQNQKVSFVYYSIGGIFGDAEAALKVGECYENGYNEDFGIDRNKALRWYEYARDKLHYPTAGLAVGRIKHALANSTKDPVERDELRRKAYSAFEKAYMVDPYAKFMIATYNLNGWGCRQPDPVRGFDILLSLVETGFNMALRGIAKCYEQGVGVERDLAKSSAYQELAVQMDTQ
ncbi:hypothetical protein DFQ28_005711 [Apophysomyces sp. BC1034]|nr:hypothetical protein DFQ28_005711 [Apophysomyces sp. BC1034]